MFNALSSKRKQKKQAERFDNLVRPHVAHLYRAAFHLTGSQHAAEDLVQDVLTKLYPKTDELEKIEKLRPWMATVLTNLFIDSKRHLMASPVSYTDDNQALDEIMYDSRQCPEHILDQNQQIDQLQEAFNQLIEEHKIVLILHDIEGYSLPELVKTLSVPIGTLKSRLFRARNRLQFILENLQSGEPLSIVNRVNE